MLQTTEMGFEKYVCPSVPPFILLSELCILLFFERLFFVFHSVWWQLPLFECDKFGDTAPLTVYYLICTVTNYVKVDHHLCNRGNFCSCKKKAWKKLYKIQTLDLCNTGAALLTTWANKPTARSSGKRAAPVSQRSRVWILYKPEFFSGFLFATAKVASICVMIYFHIILHPAVHIYVFHIFITLQ